MLFFLSHVAKDGKIEKSNLYEAFVEMQLLFSATEDFAQS